MTDSTGKKITWLEYRSQVTGKSIEELREEMRQRGAKSSAHSSFIKNTPEQRKAISMKGVEARKAKREENERVE